MDGSVGACITLTRTATRTFSCFDSLQWLQAGMFRNVPCSQDCHAYIKGNIHRLLTSSSPIDDSRAKRSGRVHTEGADGPKDPHVQADNGRHCKRPQLAPAPALSTRSALAEVPEKLTGSSRASRFYSKSAACRPSKAQMTHS